MVYSSAHKHEQLVWRTRDGQRLGTLGPPGDHYTFRISPDGSEVALSVTEASGQADVWLLDVSGSVPVRLTTSPATDINGMWSDDGRHVFFTSRRAGRDALHRISADGKAEEVVFTPPRGGFTRDVDESHGIVVQDRGGLVAYALKGDAGGWPLAENGSASEWLDLVSPNGRWLAYSANETGRDEIYVAAFPHPGRRWPVSRGGGVRPRWSADGKELFYVGADGRLFAVPVVTEGSFRADEPVVLFDLDGATHYDVSPDGRRFLVNVPLPEPPELNVVMDWKAALTR
jgi:dipeptidyl aminopeptidase/acylaminoacyl peptidase